MMTKLAVEELIFMPESIRENNFMEKGTIIRFHKTATPIQHMTETSVICTITENIVTTDRT